MSLRPRKGKKFPAKKKHNNKMYKLAKIFSGDRYDERGAGYRQGLREQGEETMIGLDDTTQRIAVYARKRGLTSKEEAKAKKEVRKMGFAEGRDLAKHAKADFISLKDGMLIVEGEEREIGDYLGDYWEARTQFSGWDFILADLRRIAGFRDPMNVGTYQDGTDDQYWLFDELVGIYSEGVDEGFDRGMRTAI